MKRHTLVANKLLVLFSGLSKETKTEQGYNYEKHTFGLTDSFTKVNWSSTLIKQTLYYLSKCDSHGQIIFMSEDEVAKEIHCSIRTVQNNNNTLESKGILKWDRLWGQYIKVDLIDYLKNFLDLEVTTQDTDMVEDGSDWLAAVLANNTYRSKAGYTSISAEVLEKIFALKDVNAIRVAMRALYVYEKEVNVQKGTEALLSYRDVKNILPNYLGYRDAIRRIAVKLKSIFEVEVIEKANVVKTYIQEQAPTKSVLKKIVDGFVVSFNLSGKHDSKTMKQIDRVNSVRVFTQFKDDMKKYVEGDLSLTDKQVCNFADEFGFDILSKVFTVIKEDMHTAAINDIAVYNTMRKSLKEHISLFVRKIATGYQRVKIAQ